MFTTFSNGNSYILLLKADEFLRDRSVVAAIRAFDGMVCGMAPLPALNRVRVFDHVLTGDPHRPEEALRAVQAFEESSGMVPKAVIPITEMSLESASMIAEAYGISFLSRASVGASRNKRLMKEAFLRHQVSTPKHLPFASLEQLIAAADQLGYPVIVKPTRAAHSIGVCRIDSPEAIEAGFKYCKTGLESISSTWGIEDGLFQVEQYIEADRELSVEVINYSNERQVIAVTDKFLTPPPYFAEVGHRVPSVESNNLRIKELALQACHALGLTHGIAHVEIRIDATGVPYVIEVASRPGGDGIMDLVERAYGVNLYDLHIRSYLGTLADRNWNDLKLLGVAAIAFMPAKTGVVQEMRTPSSLPEEVTGLYLSTKVGDHVGGSLNYDNRLGTVECFWPNRTGISDNRHLEMAEKLRDEFYTIKA